MFMVLFIVDWSISLLRVEVGGFSLLLIDQKIVKAAPSKHDRSPPTDWDWDEEGKKVPRLILWMRFSQA